MAANKVRSQPNRDLLAGLALVIITALAYLPALGAGFIWDDDVLLTGNPFIKLPSGLFYIWCSTALPDYFPLTSSSFWLEWRIWGPHPAGYHLTNILLHAGSSVLLWRIFLRLGIPVSWLAALVFAVHPVNVESVAWLAERKNTLSFFFGALSVLFYLRSEDESAGGKSAGFSRTFWFALGSFVLSLLAKTSGVMLPLVLLLLVWRRKGRIQRGDIVQTIPFFAASLVLGLVTVWFQTNRAIAGEAINDSSLPARIAGAAWAICFYLWKALVPFRLSFVYPRWQIDPANPWHWLPWVFLAAGFVLCWRFRKSWGRPCLVAIGSFVLLLLPVLGFFNIYFQRYSFVADHWQYFALPAMVALIVGGLATILTRIPAGSAALTSWPARAVISGAAILFAVLTWQQSRIYSDKEALWRDTLARNPRCWLAFNNLGVLLSGRGEADEAKAMHLRALEIEPRQIEAHNNLGELLSAEGKTDAAIAHFQQALEINPRSAMTLYNLANVLDRVGQTDEAVKLYRKAIELEPMHAEARNNLGCILYAAGKTDEAMEEFARAFSLRPQYADAVNNIGTIFLDRGETREAESQFREALRVDPFHADARLNLGNALMSQGRAADAALAYARVVEMNPTNAVAHCRLATAQWHLGNSQPAFSEISMALKLAPNLAEAYCQAGIMLGSKKEFDAAIAHLRKANELKPNSPETLAALGLALATAPANKRNPAEAFEACARAVEITGKTNTNALNAYGGACASAGKYDEAIEAAARAADLASSAGMTNLAATFRARQRLYENKLPYAE